MTDKITTVEMREAGTADVLETGSREMPVPAAGEVLIKVTAAGVNGPDLVQRRGHYPPPKGASDLLGLEVSGTIAALADGVTDWSIGDEVCALTNGGGYATYCTVLASHVLPVPDGVSLEDAAGLPETYFTVWSNVFMAGGLKAGDRFLVHGGAGGIGTTAIQLAKAFGATVIATDSPDERCQICRDLGADIVLDYTSDDFVEVVREAGGADVILDIVGGDYIAKNIKAAAADARIIQLAFNKGSKLEINLMPIMLKRLVYTGSTLRSRPESQKTEIASQLREQVWPLFAEGKLKAVTAKRFSFSQAAEAHSTMEAATHTGKILMVADQ